MSALASLMNLESLDLSGTDVSDRSALAGLTSLRELNLDAKIIKDVSALDSLTNQGLMICWVGE